MAYGARIRSVEMTRGGRQGNNAFLEYQDNDHSKGFNFNMTYSKDGRTTLDPIFEKLDVDQFKTLERLMMKAVGN